MQQIPETRYFQCGRFRFALDERPLVMGILNVTPDSFSDGGQHAGRDAAVRHAEQMIAEGVDIIDIGGESSRPGSAALPLEDELARVIPVVEALRDCGKPLSIDTYKPEVMRAAMAAGADLINDIWGFRMPGAVEVLAAPVAGRTGLCVMHMQRDPQTMQEDPHYQDVVGEVADFLAERIAVLRAAGIDDARLSLDPGFGFGKTPDHNLRLLGQLPRIALEGLPVLAGISRKSTLGAILGGRPPQQRIAASIAAAVCAVERGAFIVRVHDVEQTVDAVKTWWAVRNESVTAA
ncbi:dihydropteroate synthase [Cupriavidus consociatus]|uniref:dihydropteroate synthase n=1 Tax=Cupriavidus consociatus TaxID=2821357 RepID=UPI001AE6F883|nr:MULTISPECIES: dihydropteroate synthase [unclassified Cupriavidus]MBP0618366.1 dihydropteroate synthase [Cupriavidus sp. LEh25]MDK2655001.1 dihydropteroate synthase [Cupriavidus sp. LEh21]